MNVSKHVLKESAAVCGYQGAASNWIHTATKAKGQVQALTLSTSF